MPTVRGGRPGEAGGDSGEGAKRLTKSDPARVLFVKPCCLGDVLLATPVLEAVACAWPGAKIGWAIDRHSRDAVAGHPAVDELLDASHCIRGDFRPACYLGLVRRIRARAYDTAFVPDRSPLMALVPLLGGVPVRIGLDSGGRGWAHTVRVPAVADRHEAQLYLDLVRAIGLETPVVGPVFRIGARARTDAKGALGKLQPPLVAMHPGGGVNPGMRLPEKRWPAARFGELCDAVADQMGARTVLVGGEGDRELAAAVAAAARTKPLDLTGRLTLEQTAAVIELCELYVGNDTGVTHLAGAVGTPVVAIFGPTDPERYGPLPGTGVAVAAPGGAVANLGAARGSDAIERVSVDQVLSALTSLATRKGLPRS